MVILYPVKVAVVGRTRGRFIVYTNVRGCLSQGKGQGMGKGQGQGHGKGKGHGAGQGKGGGKGQSRCEGIGKGQGQGEGKGQRQGKGGVQSKGEAKDEGQGMGPGSVASSFASSPALVAIPSKRGSISPGPQTTEGGGGAAYKKLKVGSFFIQSKLGFAPADEQKDACPETPDADVEIAIEEQMAVDVEEQMAIDVEEQMAIDVEEQMAIDVEKQMDADAAEHGRGWESA